MLNLSCKGWNSQAQMGIPGGFESRNLSRDNIIMEIGRIGTGLVGTWLTGYPVVFLQAIPGDARIVQF